MRTFEQLAKANDTRTPVCWTDFFPIQLKREKKKETHIFYCAFCSLELNTKNILIFQINSLQTENFCLGLCGGRVTASSTTKSPQTAKALCKKEYTAISFLFFSLFCILCSSWFYQHFIFLHRESTINPKGTLNGSLSFFRVLNVWIPSAEEKNERKLHLFILRLCLTHQLLDDNLESFKLS